MTIEEIKNKIAYGDYNVLQKLLGAPSVGAARAKFLREDPEAIAAMEAIIKNREELISKFKSQTEDQKESYIKSVQDKIRSGRQEARKNLENAFSASQSKNAGSHGKDRENES